MSSLEHQNRIYITNKAKLKQDRLVALVPAEVGWIGIVEERGNYIVVTDILVPEQEVSSGSVDYLDEGLHKLIVDNINVADKLKYFGHSHYTMDAFFSLTDINEHISKYAETGGYDYIINYVQNKQGESRARIDIFEPVQVFIEVEIMETIPKEIDNWADQMVKENVAIKKVLPQRATTISTTKDHRPIEYIHNIKDIKDKGRFVIYDGGRRKEFCDGQLISDQSVTSKFEHDEVNNSRSIERSKKRKEKRRQKGKGKRVETREFDLLPYDIQDVDEWEGAEFDFTFSGMTGVSTAWYDDADWD